LRWSNPAPQRRWSNSSPAILRNEAGVVLHVYSGNRSDAAQTIDSR
jgi:hypothetical protein